MNSRIKCENCIYWIQDEKVLGYSEGYKSCFARMKDDGYFLSTEKDFRCHLFVGQDNKSYRDLYFDECACDALLDKDDCPVHGTQSKPKQLSCQCWNVSSGSQQKFEETKVTGVYKGDCPIHRGEENE